MELDSQLAKPLLFLPSNDSFVNGTTLDYHPSFANVSQIILNTLDVLVDIHKIPKDIAIRFLYF